MSCCFDGEATIFDKESTSFKSEESHKLEISM